jgi:hypothetical protein
MPQLRTQYIKHERNDLHYLNNPLSLSNEKDIEDLCIVVPHNNSDPTTYVIKGCLTKNKLELTHLLSVFLFQNGSPPFVHLLLL